MSIASLLSSQPALMDHGLWHRQRLTDHHRSSSPPSTPAPMHGQRQHHDDAEQQSDRQGQQERPSSSSSAASYQHVGFQQAQQQRPMLQPSHQHHHQHAYNRPSSSSSVAQPRQHWQDDWRREQQQQQPRPQSADVPFASSLLAPPSLVQPTTMMASGMPMSMHFASDPFGHVAGPVQQRSAAMRPLSSSSSSNAPVASMRRRSNTLLSYESPTTPRGMTASSSSSSTASASRLAGTSMSALPPALEAPPPRLDPFVLLGQDEEPRTYRLIIRQSPKHGQMCTLGSKERRILDPLPIVQLDVRGRGNERDIIGQASPLLVMQVNLIADHITYSESASRLQGGSERARSRSSDGSSSSGRSSGMRSVVGMEPSQSSSSALLPAPHEVYFPAMRLLEGKLTASAHIVRDAERYLSKSEAQERRVVAAAAAASAAANNTSAQLEAGMVSAAGRSDSGSDDDDADHSNAVQAADAKACFFIFTDLSIRLSGTYRLQFSLIRLGLPSPSGGSGAGGAGQIVAQAVSESFPVVSVRDFVGMSESTPLAKSLAAQGLHVPIRNRGPAAPTAASPKHASSLKQTLSRPTKKRKTDDETEEGVKIV